MKRRAGVGAEGEDNGEEAVGDSGSEPCPAREFVARARPEGATTLDESFLSGRGGLDEVGKAAAPLLLYADAVGELANNPESSPVVAGLNEALGCCWLRPALARLLLATSDDATRRGCIRTPPGAPGAPPRPRSPAWPPTSEATPSACGKPGAYGEFTPNPAGAEELRDVDPAEGSGTSSAVRSGPVGCRTRMRFRRSCSCPWICCCSPPKPAAPPLGPETGDDAEAQPNLGVGLPASGVPSTADGMRPLPLPAQRLGTEAGRAARA